MNAAWGRRVAIKAIVLFVAFDFLQGALRLDSWLTNLSLYRFLVPPLARIDIMRDYPSPVLWRVRPLLDAHRIGRPKAPGELRVAVLGDSGTFGMFVRAEQAVPGQMTALAEPVSGKRLIAYNLAYQTPNALKDVLLLDDALRRRLDGVVWFVTLYDLAYDEPPPYRHFVHLIIRANADDLLALCARYHIDTWETRELLARRRWYRRSLFWAGRRYRDFALLLARSGLDALAGGDPTESVRPRRPWIGAQPLTVPPLFADTGPGEPAMPNSRWRTILAGVEMARRRGVPVLLVNDPIFIASGPHSEGEYNSFYAKDIYDRYRSTLARFCAAHGIALLDLWNAVPPREFDDTPEHYTVPGNARIARAVDARLAEMLR